MRSHLRGFVKPINGVERCPPGPGYSGLIDQSVRLSNLDASTSGVRRSGSPLQTVHRADARDILFGTDGHPSSINQFFTLLSFRGDMQKPRLPVPLLLTGPTQDTGGRIVTLSCSILDPRQYQAQVTPRHRDRHLVL